MEIASQKKNEEILNRKELRLKISQSESYRRAVRVASQIGVTRVAEIGRFVDDGIYVCQATRPALHLHYTTGLNTGSQGKGYTFEQAYISSVMESAEAYSGELRVPNLVRASYADLRKSHAVASPVSFVPPNSRVAISDREPFMWAHAMHLGLKREVLIPAELIYFFLMPEFYECRSAYMGTSGGLGAGFDLATATRKAILERLEDHYLGHFERLDVKVEGLIPQGPIAKLLKRHSARMLNRNSILFYAISIPGFRRGLPFVVCYMGDRQRFHTGYGFGLDPIKAIESAHLEAFQSWVTNVSGAREDLAIRPAKPDRERQKKFDRVWPNEAKLEVEKFKRRFSHLSAKSDFSGKKDDVDILENILKLNGYRDVYLANLSRKGVEASVVRAVIPGLWSMEGRYRRPKRQNQLSFASLMQRMFLFGEERS